MATCIATPKSSALANRQRLWAFAWKAYAINAINENIVMVGFSNIGTSNHAFGYVPGDAITDLNDRLDASAGGWVITRAYDINNAGAIVGEGTPNGVSQAVLLMPVLEPTSAGLLCSSVLAKTNPPAANRLNATVHRAYGLQLPS